MPEGEQNSGMTATDTSPGTPPKADPDGARAVLEGSPSHTPPGTPSKNLQDSLRAPPVESPYHTPAGSPSKNPGQGTFDSPATLAEKEAAQPETFPVDEGPREDGSIKMNFNVHLRDGSPMPVQGVIALALNEAARQLGRGMIYYLPSRYPLQPNVPQLFYHNAIWDDMDKDHWDMASHNDRLEMCTQLRSELKVMPIRVLMFDEPQAKIQFNPEDYRLSSVVITYDQRPYMDWYQNYASRRDETRGIISVDVTRYKMWFRSIRRTDNIQIVATLSQWYERPLQFGLKNYGKTITRIMDCEERRLVHDATVIHGKRPEERSDDDTSSDDSDNGQPEPIVPVPLRKCQSMSDEGFEETNKI